MYTIIAILLLLLIAVFGTLLYYRSKKSRLTDLQNGKCPVCYATTKTFKDEATRTVFSVEAIEQNILKKHGCSGTMEVEFSCKSCGNKEVHTIFGSGCKL